MTMILLGCLWLKLSDFNTGIFSHWQTAENGVLRVVINIIVKPSCKILLTRLCGSSNGFPSADLAQGLVEQIFSALQGYSSCLLGQTCAVDIFTMLCVLSGMHYLCY